MTDSAQRQVYLVALAERRLDQAKAHRNQKQKELYYAEAELTKAYAELEAAQSAVTST